MDAGWAAVVAAVVAAVGAIIVAALDKFRKENANDHAYVQGLLTMLHKSTSRIERKVERVDERLTDHLEFHTEQGVLDNGRRIDQDGVEGNS